METKTCIYCSSILAADLFVNGKNQCKPCRNRYMRKYYSNDSHQRVHNRKLVKANKRNRQRRKRDFVNSLKNHPCQDCGQSFHPYVMDFDHLDPTTKRADVSQLVLRACSENVISEEVAKCDLVCSNCHRIRTFKRRYGEEVYLQLAPK